MSRHLKSSLVALVAALDVWVVWLGGNVTAERVSIVKVVCALTLQLASIGLFAFFVGRPVTSNECDGPWESFRSRLTPYILGMISVGLALSLLYNAIACGQQSFFDGRRGEPICKPGT